MRQGYWKTCWADVSGTPGWLGKICRLALVQFIPIFGSMVSNGYLFGWARDIAWGVHEPMKKSIFDNSDGKLYSRGFFYLVISFVCTLLPLVIEYVWMFTASASAGMSSAIGGSMGADSPFAASPFFSSGGTLVMFAVELLAIAGTAFAFVGAMRMSIYGNLSAGLQFGKIWAMIRQDLPGLFRILGMVLIMYFVLVLIFSIVFTILLLIGGVAFFATMAGSQNGSLPSDTAGGVVAGAIVFGLALAAAYYFLMVGAMFVITMAIRAIGYWTQQFQVALWGPQEAPLPFQLVGTGEQTPPNVR